MQAPKSKSVNHHLLAFMQLKLHIHPANIHIRRRIAAAAQIKPKRKIEKLDVEKNGEQNAERRPMLSHGEKAAAPYRIFMCEHTLSQRV